MKQSPHSSRQAPAWLAQTRPAVDAAGLRAVRGIASPAQPGDFTHIRRAPSARLSAYVEHLWYVAWQLPAGAATRVATVPHPCVHWTFEAGRSTLTGPHPRLWQRALTPRGEVLGIKFRPEGFRVLCGAPMVSLRGQIFNPTALPQLAFAHDLGPVLHAAQSRVSLDGRFDVLEHRLAAVLPAPTADQVQVAQLIEAARCDPDLHRADAWAQQSGIALRQLQRWLADWVGLSPKWILGRYRLHDMLHRLQQHPAPRLSDLAAEAGYADAAHFSRSFRSVLGVSPQQYLRIWRGG